MNKVIDVVMNINFDDYEKVSKIVKNYEKRYKKIGSIESFIWERYLAIKLLECIPYYEDTKEVLEFKNNLLNNNIESILYKDDYSDLFSIINYLEYEQDNVIEINFNNIPLGTKEFKRVLSNLISLITNKEDILNDGKNIKIVIQPLLVRHQ